MCKSNKQNIKNIVNDKHYGYPRVGRQNGVNIANGEWITFADQDDYYLYNSIDAVKKTIENENIEDVLFCAIYKENTKTKERIYENPNRAWTHGKFIKRSFWNEHNICYDDIESNEDSNIVTKIQCILILLDKKLHVFNSPVYVWNNHIDSLGHAENNMNTSQYINAVVRVVIDYLVKYKDNQRLFEIYARSFILCLYRVYFYTQEITLNFDKESMFNTIKTFQPLYEQFKQVTGMKNKDIVCLTYMDYAEHFNEIRNEVCDLGVVVERLSFMDWVNTYLNSDDQEDYIRYGQYVRKQYQENYVGGDIEVPEEVTEEAAQESQP